jgi:hypothetical protein
VLRLRLSDNANDSVKCWDCVYNCFDYLKCRERVRDEQKLFRQLLKREFGNNNNNNPPSTSSVAFRMNRDIYSQENDDDNEADVILLDQQESPSDANENNKENKSNSPPGNAAASSAVTANEAWFWAGKESLKQWSSLAIKRFESQLPSAKFLDLEVRVNGETIDGELADVQQVSPGGGSGNEIQEIIPLNPQVNNVNSSAAAAAAAAVVSIVDATATTLNFFNEDILCPHNDLSPTPNKRLICASLWTDVLSRYFDNKPPAGQHNSAAVTFAKNHAECVHCLRANEEHTSKKNQVKNQKDILPDLYANRKRPVFNDCELFVDYYLIMADFVKEWRTLIKQSKFRDIKIFNETLLCPHGSVPFDETTIDDSM